MKLKKSSNHKTSIASFFILCISFLGTLVFGIIGYHAAYPINTEAHFPHLVHWGDVLYSTFRLFTLYETPSDEAFSHWGLSLGRLLAFCTIFSSIAFATIMTIGGWLRSNILVRYYRDHYIILGLNEQSSVLATDLLSKKKKVIIVYDGLDNIFLEEMTKKGAAIVSGDISDVSIYIKASIMSAKALVTLSGDDLTNLSALQCIIDSSYKPELQCFIGLDNVNSYKLFEPDAFYSIQNIKEHSPGLYINTFNVNELIAIDLIKHIGLGVTSDIVSEDASPVKVLLLGFSPVAESILRELLLLGHFCNGKKIEIQIVADSDNGFFTSHHQVMRHANGQGLDLWDIYFIDNEAKLDLDRVSDFDHIISTYVDDEKSLSTILKYYDLCTVMRLQELDSSTTFHYFSSHRHDIRHQYIKTFGAMEDTINVERLINQYDEDFVRKSHERYVKVELGLNNVSPQALQAALIKHDKEESNSSRWLQWENQPLFKRRSNFTESRHQIIKMQALGGRLPTQDDLNAISVDIIPFNEIPFVLSFPELKTPQLQGWLAYIMQKEQIGEDELIERIHALARSEHNRWNAFHIVNNWRYGSEKNEKLKTHDCLLSWSDLEKQRADTIKYDYKNIYHLSEYIESKG